MKPFPFSKERIELKNRKSLYFCSDFHLGAPNPIDSRQRERDVVRWLGEIEENAQMLFLMGDIFDYWFEYRHVVPKGYVRLLGKLAQLVDNGIKLVYFTGNHDMWMRDYFASEMDVDVRSSPSSIEVFSADGAHTFLLGHGDGLGNGDFTYKGLKKLFENRMARWAFRQVHPDLGMKIATKWSKMSRSGNAEKGEEQFKGEQKEWLYQYCLEIEKIQHHDFYIFGHRHLELDMAVGAKSRYINLGEWFTPHTRQPYGRFDGREFVILSHREKP